MDGMGRVLNVYQAHITSTVPSGPAVLGDPVTGRIIGPEDVHTVIPGTCEYGILHSKKGLCGCN